MAIYLTNIRTMYFNFYLKIMFMEFTFVLNIPINVTTSNILFVEELVM